MSTEIQEIKIKDYETTQKENDIESFVETTYNEMVLDIVNKIKNQKQWGMTASTIFINRLFSQHERISTVEFSIENRNYGAKFNFPSKEAKDEFQIITENIKRLKSHYLERFNYKNDVNAQSLLNIFINYLSSNDTSKCFENNSTGIQNDLREENSYISLEEIDSTTKATLKNWENDFIIDLDVSKSNQDEKIINKLMILPAYHNLFIAISQDNYIFVFGTSTANQHYVDERVRDIENVFTFSMSIFKANDSPLELFDKFHLLSSTYRNVMLYEFAADLNKNIESSLGEASEVSRYWYTTGVQKILKESKLEKSSDSELFSRLLVEEILAADIDGVDTLEVYPFDRVFLFNRPIDRLIEEGDRNEISVAEGLLASKISITQAYINEKTNNSGMKLEDIFVHEDKDGSSQYLFEWQRTALGLKDHEVNFNKKFIKNQSAMQLKKLKDKYNFKSDYHASDEVVINSLLNMLLHGTDLDVEAAKQALLEYKAKYFKDDFLYLYATGVDLPKEIPILYYLQERYFEYEQSSTNTEHLRENEFQKTKQKYMSQEELRNVKVVLASYAPRDEESNDGFTMIVIANQDPIKTTSELDSERDDLRTALELIVRQKFVLQKEYDEKSKKAKEDTFKTLTQAQHTLDNFLKERIKQNEEISKSDLELLRTKIHDLLTPMTESLSTDKKEEIYNVDNEDTLSRSLSIFQKFFINNKRFDTSAQQPLAYDYFSKKIVALEKVDDRLVVFEYPLIGNTKKIIELTVDLNELEAFKIDWDQEILHDVLHVMFKNACEASFEYLEKTSSTKVKIFIDLFTSKVSDTDACLNIEFTNFTSEPISKSRLKDINEKTSKITENIHKTNSSGIGVPTARGRLQHRYNDELNSAGITYTLIAKDKMKSKLYLPISLIIDESIFADEQNLTIDSKIFYLEDELEYYQDNAHYFNDIGVEYQHKTSYQGLKSSYKDEKVLITDLNIYAKENRSTTEITDQQHGLDAIVYFMEKVPTATIIILSTGYSSAEKFLIEHAKAHNFTIHNKFKGKKEPYTHLNKQSIYIYEQKRFAQGDTEVISFLEKLIDKKAPEIKIDNVSKVDIKRKYFETINIDTIEEVQKYADSAAVHKKAFILDLSDNSKDLEKTLQVWQDHKIICDDEKYSISSPVRGSYFNTKLVIIVKQKSDYPQVRHESLKNNVIIVAKTANLDELLNTISTLSVNSNGVFSPIRHDFAKVKPFGTIEQSDIDYFASTCTYLETLFIQDYEIFLKNGKIQNHTVLMKEFYIQFNHVIDEATKQKNELGENRKILSALFDRYNYYYNIGSDA